MPLTVPVLMLLFLSANAGICAVRWRLRKEVSARRRSERHPLHAALKRTEGLPVVEMVMPCPSSEVEASKWNGRDFGRADAV